MQRRDDKREWKRLKDLAGEEVNVWVGESEEVQYSTVQ